MNWVKEDGSSDWTFDIVGLVQRRPRRRSRVRQRAVLQLRLSRRSPRDRQRHRASVRGVDRRRKPRVSEIARRDRPAVRQLQQRNDDDEREGVSHLAARQVGDVQMFVNSIIGAVLFTLLFLAGNTMSQSVRDRIPEFGVLKTLGFSDNRSCCSWSCRRRRCCVCLRAAVGPRDCRVRYSRRCSPR